MNSSILSELIGAVAALLVLISYTFKDQRRLRIVGIVSCIVFTLYGLQIAYLSNWVNGWSTITLNISCIIVNGVRLRNNDKDNNR